MNRITTPANSSKNASRIVRRPLPENDPKQRQPDISLAQELLDWKPHVPLKEGLAKILPSDRPSPSFFHHDGKVIDA
jgi:nucleoside-diphosphate-sugar epimerase